MTANGGRRSLLQRAWIMLQRGPAPTSDVAREVLGLKSHAAAGSRAVFALLGNDDRFHVDDLGRWNLRGGARPPGTPLSRLCCAVVDIETTGGRHGAGHRITEIAVVEVRAGSVTDAFHTLVHPGRRVRPAAARLTGITDDMLVGAPAFDEVAEEVFRRIAGRVFVAHNAAFDWGWVRAQLGDALGDVPEVKRLCTISLARRLAPDLGCRSLDALAEYFDIPVPRRHRAYGDALATARILLRLLDRAQNLGIGDLRSLKRYRPQNGPPGQADLFVRVGLPRRSRTLV